MRCEGGAYADFRRWCSDASGLYLVGALFAIALELHVCNLYVAAATAKESSALPRDHSSEILTFDAVGAPYRVSIVPPPYLLARHFDDL